MNSTANNVQNIKCGWAGCSHYFGSEIDMNMHVVMNHMVLLDHGEFLLNRRVQNRKRTVREPTPEQIVEPVVEPIFEEPVVQIPVPKVPKIAERPEFQPIIRAPAQIEHKPLFSNNIFGILPANVPGNAPIAPQVQQVPQVPQIAQTPRIPLKVDFDIFRNNGQGTSSSSTNPIVVPVPIPEPRIQDEVEDVEVEMDQIHQDQGQLILAQLHQPRKMSKIVDEFLERLRPMKQLGFIRPNRSVYCIVCLKYVKSFHECNWKHTPAEDRVAEMWFRRFGPEKPSGKVQLMRELEEIKIWLQNEEEDGIVQEGP